MIKKYLKSFFSELAYETFKKTSYFILPNVSYTGEDDITHYNPEESPDVKWEAKYGAKIVEKHDNLSGYIAEHEIPASIGVGEDLESVVVKDVVAVIGDKAFKGYTTLKSITLPDTIQRINSYSFSGCTSLSSVTIPSSVNLIGYKAFKGCSGLTNITVEATTPPSIAAGAFDGIECCINVPQGTEDAYKRVWWQYADRIGGDCSVITYSIALSGNDFIHANDVYIRWGSDPIQHTQKITGYGTYTYATTANTLPIDITVAGPDSHYTYEFDPQLPITLTKESPSATVEVTVEERLPKWRVTLSDGNIEDADCDETSAITENEITDAGIDKAKVISVALGDCVTDLNPRAFLQFGNLERAVLSSSVKNIGIQSFAYDTNLSAVTNYSNVETIGNSAFNYCTSLRTAPISDKVTTIGFSAFAYCPISGNVTIPDSCTYIGEGAFQYCSAMTTVEIGSGITTISGSAFCDCSALTSVTINALVPPTLGLQPFEREGNNFRIYVPCQSLSAYRNAEGWSYYANQHKIQAKNCNKYYATYTNGGISIKECDGNSSLVQGEVNTTDLAKINIGDCVATIGNSAFYYCTSLTSVTIGSGVTTIGVGAFSNCRGLTSITVPNSVTNIDSNAFIMCNSLTSCTIGNSVTNIGTMAFDSCTSLTSVTVNATTPPTLGTDAFNRTNNCPIYVPAESVDAYKAATNWSKYASRIQPIQ